MEGIDNDFICCWELASGPQGPYQSPPGVEGGADARLQQGEEQEEVRK
jgi:hypothetical protein